MSRPRARLLAGTALVVLLALAAVVGGYAATRGIRHVEAAPRATPPAPPAVYGSAAAAPAAGSSPAPAPVPTAAGVAAQLRSALTASGLGSRVRADVTDVTTGAVLYGRDATTGTAPASTAKLLTAAAVLTVHSVDDRITTTAMTASGGTLVLVGGGDPTLTGAAAGRSGAYPDAARLSDLASAIDADHVTVNRIVVDDGLFSGPSVSPAWVAEDVPSSYGAAITAVMTDGGRAAPGDSIRSASPDLAAGQELAALLGHPSLPVSRGAAPAGARTVATVRSATYGTLIEQMLHESDNVIAECLGRQVALAEHGTPSFTGAAAAIRQVLQRDGIAVGAGMLDASGLAASDRVSATALADVVRLAAGTSHTRLRPLLAALPVAAWSGTLVDRYVTGSAASAAGVVRAKTGTLTGVSTLAGLVHDRSGRLLAFAFLADRTGSTPAAEAALDVVVARLAGCGCTG